MFTKIFAIALLALCAVIGQSEAAECEPLSVTNLTLNTNHTLTWRIRAEEECIITEYLIYIFHIDHPVEYNFAVTETEADVSFLGVCQEWTFVVIPVSEHTSGRQQRIVGSLPLPTSTDLTINTINITRMGPIMERHLEWDLIDTHLENCSIQYRLSVEVEGNPYIDDIYTTETSINLRFLSPCSTYLFGVRAINIGNPTIEGPLKQAEHHISMDRQSAPRLVSATPTSDGFNATWAIESVVRNACRIRSLYLDGGVLFRRSFDLDEADGRGPIEVTVTDLTPNTMYYFRTMLLNTAGYSHPSLNGIQTLSLTQDE